MHIFRQNKKKERNPLKVIGKITSTKVSETLGKRKEIERKTHGIGNIIPL